MMRREHTHYCDNRSRGCKAEFTCRAEPEVDEDGAHCPYDNDLFECDDCSESRCSECGSVLAVERHVEDCPKSTQV